MSQDDLKRRAAEAAMEYIQGGVIGVGTGSTVNHFIDLLAQVKHKIEGAVSSSEASTKRLKSHGIPVLDLNATGELDLYVDGADESNRHLHLIKGGGAAHTLEKIVHALSDRFIVVADESKLSPFLGQNFAVPLEVLPAGRLLVERELQRLGAREIQLRMAQRKDGPVISDNGNMILDARFERFNPLELEQQLDAIPGVVACGIFARYRPARGDCLIGQAGGVRQL